MTIKSSKKKNVWKMRYVGGRNKNRIREISRVWKLRYHGIGFEQSHFLIFARNPPHRMHTTPCNWLSHASIICNRYFRLWRRVAAGDVYSEPVWMNTTPPPPPPPPHTQTHTHTRKFGVLFMVIRAQVHVCTQVLQYYKKVDARKPIGREAGD